jgi:hypothetical protein
MGMKVQRTNLVLYRFNKLLLEGQVKMEFIYDNNVFKVISGISLLLKEDY